MDIRGLTKFIQDLRKCSSKDAEQTRVDKEMGKVRKQFKNPEKLIGYDRKKCVLKLLCCYMMGYEIDFGHMEAVNLMASSKYSEKAVGYLACSIFFNEEHEMLPLITNTISKDLDPEVNANRPEHQSLALSAVANIGGAEFAESLAQTVQKLVVSPDTKVVVRKKACLCLLRLFRKYPEVLPPDTWSSKVVQLLDSRDLGVITAVASLLVGLSSVQPEFYAPCVPKAIRLLHKIIVQKEYPTDYTYYGVPSPWVQVKLLRLIQYFPLPDSDELQGMISRVLQAVIRNAEAPRRGVNRQNAINAVLFEAFGVIAHYDHDKHLLEFAMKALMRFMTDKDPNYRYLGLESISRLLRASPAAAVESVGNDSTAVHAALRDPDISIRRRALDVLYSLCSTSNAEEIVGSLMQFLSWADYAIREDLVLKIAILAEKFATNLTWYVDIILKLIKLAGDFVFDAVWHRVVYVVTNSQNEGIQRYAAESMYKAVVSPSAHETGVKVAAYILGEFGHLIVGAIPASEQFRALHNKFDTVSDETKAMLLHTYAKFMSVHENSDPQMAQQIRKVYEQYGKNVNTELQQRSCEYLSMLGGALIGKVLEQMPPFPEAESSVVKRIEKREQSATDRVTWKESDGNRARSTSITDRPAGSLSSSETVEVAAPTQAPAVDRAANALEDLLDLGGTSAPAPTPAPAPTAAAAAPAPKADVNVMDLLMDSTPAAAPKATQPSTSPIDDIFGSGPSSHAAPAGGSIAPAATVNSEHYFKLCAERHGVLYEDQHIQILVKSDLMPPQARFALAYSNKSAHSPITQLHADMPTTSSMKCQLSSVAQLIPPRSQVQQAISLECENSGLESPVLTIRFRVDGQDQVISVKFPASLLTFLSPHHLPGAMDFFSKWNPLTANSGGHEVQRVLQLKAGVDKRVIEQTVTNGFAMASLTNIDQNPNNLVLSATLKPVNGTIDVLLARVEIVPAKNAARITARSTSQKLAELFRDVCAANF